MTPYAVVQVPVVPGWATKHDPAADQLVAERLDDLTDYQRIYGCRTEVHAADPRELEALCVAETVHAAMVEKAEKAVRGDRAE